MRARPEILARSLLLPNDTEFNFGSAIAYFPAGKAGRLATGAKIAGDVAAAKAKADTAAATVAAVTQLIERLKQDIAFAQQAKLATK